MLMARLALETRWLFRYVAAKTKIMLLVVRIEGCPSVDAC